MQSKTNERILIGLCTYNRPQMLKECLQSLVVQEIPENVELIFCVADNSSNAAYNIKEIVDTTLNGYNYDYVFVGKRGISLARNAVLDMALKHNADFIAFLDDDEVADKDWIKNLYNTITSSNADAVQGRVVFKLPAHTSELMASLWQPITEEGARITYVATNNVIFHKKLIQDWKLRFNESLGLTGGEDLDFFLKSQKMGGIHIQTCKATVCETVPDIRVTLKWQLFKRMRESFVMHHVISLNSGKWHVFKTFLPKAIINIIKSPFYILTGIITSSENIKYKGLRKLYNALGCVSCCCNIKIKGYKKVTGN